MSPLHGINIYKKFSKTKQSLEFSGDEQRNMKVKGKDERLSKNHPFLAYK